MYKYLELAPTLKVAAHLCTREPVPIKKIENEKLTIIMLNKQCLCHTYTITIPKSTSFIQK